jgi:hypothetical protein
MKTVIIDGVAYVEEKNSNLSDYVLVRTDSAGVHFGIPVRREGKEIELKNTRRIWYWEGAASLSQMSLEGVKKPKNCKFSVQIPSIVLTEAIEIISCTESAAKCILEVPEWKA